MIFYCKAYFNWAALVSILFTFPFLEYYVNRYSIPLFLIVNYFTSFFKSLNYFCFCFNFSSPFANIYNWLSVVSTFFMLLICFLYIYINLFAFYVSIFITSNWFYNEGVFYFLIFVFSSIWLTFSPNSRNYLLYF